MKKSSGNKKPAELVSVPAKIEVTDKPEEKNDEPPISEEQVEHLLDVWSDVVEAIDQALDVTDSIKHAEDLLEVKLMINAGMTTGLAFDNFHSRVHPHCAVDEHEEKSEIDAKKLS